MTLNKVDEFRQKIQQNRPSRIDIAGNRCAAVALIVRQSTSGPQLFFIQRAFSEKDPWSGQIAFPGGNQDPGDADCVATAIRETREEVGMSLSHTDLLGQLDDQQGKNNFRQIPLIISCLVFELSEHQQVVANNEVADMLWVDLSHLLDGANKIDYMTSYSEQPYPGLVLPGGAVLWGLTYRFVRRFLELIKNTSS